MRRFLILATLIIITLAALVVTGGIALAETGPFRSGNILFPLQRFAEKTQVWATSNKTGKASYLLDLAERRALDLATQAGKPGELRALENLNAALDQAMAAVGVVPLEDLGPLKTRLASLVGEVQVILAMLSIAPTQAPDQYAAMQAKITAISAMLAASDASQTQTADVAPGVAESAAAQTNPDATVDPQAVAFPPGSAGALHAFFPLTGAHATVGCQGCHGNGVYAGTPSQCEACHAKVKPNPHFPGVCAACHTTTAWKPATFNHQAAGATDCQSCHADKKPANHFVGQCSACHSTTVWKPASFNHQVAGATDCQSCHADKKPANHFVGQCSACHTTRAWLPATFNHQVAGATDCQSCHTKNRPANHFSGQCSACHNTSAWTPANFSHTGQTDCQSCHTKNRPANHFSGQCSACHNTSAWLPANFSHTGQTDCQSCHTKDKPVNHFSGQCSACHNSNAWTPANFSHSGQTDCQSCHTKDKPVNHFAGQCSACHSTSAWKPANFNHSGQTNCSSCHTRPAGHWGGQCSQCHSTSNWGSVNVQGHTFPMNHGGAGGNCSSCHQGTNVAVNCYRCHNQAETEKHHTEKGIFDIAGKCLGCHPGGGGGN